MNVNTKEMMVGLPLEYPGSPTNHNIDQNQKPVIENGTNLNYVEAIAIDKNEPL
jgi:hypothetical protein